MDTATNENYTYVHTLSLHDALPICSRLRASRPWMSMAPSAARAARSLEINGFAGLPTVFPWSCEDMRSWRRFAGAPQLSVPDSRCQEGDRRRRGGQRAVANVAIAAFCAAFAAVYAGRCCRRFQYASKLGGVTSSSFSMRASMNAYPTLMSATPNRSPTRYS